MTATLTQPPPAPARPPRQPLSPARRVTFVVGALISSVTIGYGVLSIVAEGSEATERTAFTMDPRGDTLTVETGTGDILVRPSDDDQVHVVRIARFSGERPTFTEQANGSGDRLSASCATGWLWWGCSVDYEVAVPAGMSLRLHTDTGDVTASEVDGSLEATSGTGDVRAFGVDGPLHLRSSTGDVRADEVRSDNVDVRASTGDVTVRFAEAPDSVSAISNTGDVSLFLPGGPYAVQAGTDTGRVITEVPTSEASPRSVLARTNTGDVEMLPTG